MGHLQVWPAARVGVVRRWLTLIFVGHGEEGSHVQPLQVDGEFAPKTEQAVRTFQGLDVGDLTVDGIVGQKTWTKLLRMWLSGDEPG